MANLLAQLRQGALPAADRTLLIQERTTRQRILADPALTARLVAEAEAASGLACEAVDDTLAAYVDAEQLAEHTREHYLPLRRHLGLCPICYEDYALVRGIIAAQQRGTVARWPLQAHAGIVLHRAMIAAALRTPAHPGGWTLYAGAVPDLPQLHAHVTLVPPAPAAFDWQIAVTLSGDRASALRVMLRYETELRVERSDAAGRVRFGAIPATWISAPDGPDLLLLFDAEQSPA